MTSKAAALELVQLSKVYGNVTAVDAINLKIPAGSYCCLLGPSGCGKTSTLRMIRGHESASSGDIIVGPRNVTDLAPAQRSTAMMFQSYALFPHLSVLDNVAFALKMRGIAKAERHAEARKLLELVDMQAYAARLPPQLSGGQQQRVALARAAPPPADLASGRAAFGARPILAAAHANRVEAAAARTRHLVHPRYPQP